MVFGCMFLEENLVERLITRELRGKDGTFLTVRAVKELGRLPRANMAPDFYLSTFSQTPWAQDFTNVKNKPETGERKALSVAEVLLRNETQPYVPKGVGSGITQLPGCHVDVGSRTGVNAPFETFRVH